MAVLLAKAKAIPVARMSIGCGRRISIVVLAANGRES